MSASWVTVSIESASNEVAIRIGVGHTLTAWQPKDGGDSAQGPTPVELLLASLGACTASTLKDYAVTRNWSLEAVEIDLEIISRPSSVSVVRLLSLQGPLESSQREELLAAAEDTAVTLMLARGVRIHTELA